MLYRGRSTPNNWYTRFVMRKVNSQAAVNDMFKKAGSVVGKTKSKDNKFRADRNVVGDGCVVGE